MTLCTYVTPHSVRMDYGIVGLQYSWMHAEKYLGKPSWLGALAMKDGQTSRSESHNVPTVRFRYPNQLLKWITATNQNFSSFHLDRSNCTRTTFMHKHNEFRHTTSNAATEIFYLDLIFIRSGNNNNQNVNSLKNWKHLKYKSKPVQSQYISVPLFSIW